MPTLQLRQPGQQPAMKLEPRIDFTGGLNLTTDRFTLAQNESPDMENVDVERRGGITRRKAVRQFGNDGGWSTNDITRMFAHVDAVSSASQVLVMQAASGYYGSGGAWTSFAGTLQITDHCQLNDLSYLVGSTGQSQKWDGSTLTALTDTHGAFQDDYGSPSGTHMPAANLCASHNGYVWVADTLENSVRYESRVRVSHPNDGGSWATNDYVDVGLGDGEAIQRIVPFRDHLVVVKETSTWAIYGYDRSTFQPVLLSGTIGATNYHAVDVSPDAVWIFSAATGLYAWSGENMAWAFEKLYPALRDGDFDVTTLDEVQVGWARDRVWVRIQMTEASQVVTFPFDPLLGAWAKYKLDIKTIVDFYDSNGNPSVVASTGASEHVVMLNQEADRDDFGDGEVDINSSYVTPWIDAGAPFIPKRWKRPEFVLKAASTYVLPVEVYANWDDTDLQSTFNLETVGPAAAGGVWGTGLWGTATWAAKPGSIDQVVRGGSIGGTGRALQLRLTGPNSVQWEVRAFTLKYRSKKPRG